MELTRGLTRVQGAARTKTYPVPFTQLHSHHNLKVPAAEGGIELCEQIRLQYQSLWGHSKLKPWQQRRHDQP